MNTKTWKLGEYCRGGVITVNTTDLGVYVIAKDWDFSTGSKRSSSQKNAKAWDSKYFAFGKDGWKGAVFFYLNHLTSSGYADIIMKWIESKTFVK